MVSLTNDRIEEIKKEINRRAELWLDNVSFDEMTICGSRTRFCLAIGLNGYMFELENWMNENDFSQFLKDEESDLAIIDYLLNKAFNKYSKRK